MEGNGRGGRIGKGKEGEMWREDLSQPKNGVAPPMRVGPIQVLYCEHIPRPLVIIHVICIGLYITDGRLKALNLIQH